MLNASPNMFKRKDTIYLKALLVLSVLKLLINKTENSFYFLTFNRK